MIVSEVMTTNLVTVTPDDTLSHAANLLRQFQFHHLPVVSASSRRGTYETKQDASKTSLVLVGLLSSNDIEMAVAVGASSSDPLHQPWQERRVAEVMHHPPISLTPSTSVAAASQILVERGLNSLPVVEYVSAENKEGNEEQSTEHETQARLAGLITRSDLLMALARSLGAFEPGMQLNIPLPGGDLTPLAMLLLLATELHIRVRSVLAAPLEGSVPLVATIRLGTINPAPLLVRLQEANIQYDSIDMHPEGATNV
jgi:acetoin utilization protein AcuB